MFVLGFYTEFVDKKPPVVLWFLSLARGTGYTLNLNTPFILLLSSRLFLTQLRRTPLANILPLDAAFPDLHIVAGYIITASVFFHAAFHLTWIILFKAWKPGLFSFTMSVATGFALFATLALIVIVTRPRIRNKHFRLFRLLHVGAAFVFFALLIFHGMFRETPETYKWITPVLIIYAVDRILRRIKASSVVLSLTADNAALQGDILVLRVPRPFSFRAGQYAEIQVPSINIEWHPFTIASAPHEDEATFFIKAHGDWTKKLRDEMEQRLQGEQDQPLKVVVRGPFGAPTQHVQSYERVVLVSGGVGATPFAAICKDLHHKNVTGTSAEHSTTAQYDYDTEALTRYNERVGVAISNLYGVDVHTDAGVGEQAEQKSVFVTDMLNITGGAREHSPSKNTLRNGSDVSAVNAQTHDSGDDMQKSSVEQGESRTTSDFSSSDDEEQKFSHYAGQASNARRLDFHRSRKISSEDEEDVLQRLSKAARMQQRKRQKSAHLYDSKAKLLAFLHTTRVQFLMILIVLIRLTIAGVGSILSKKMEKTLGWVAVADTPLAFVFSIALLLTILLELSYMSWRYLNDVGRCIDLFALVPLSVASLALDLSSVTNGSYDSETVVILQYALIIPLLFILLVVRLHRSVRLRSLLTKYIHTSSDKPAPEVDFIWTTRDENDDAWLRDELSPLTDGTDLRLHRYVTRVKEVDVEAGADLLTSMHAGRPEWDELFQKIASTAPSRSVIGVFFCGPKPMGNAVQGALRRAEIASHLRAAYLSRTPERTLLSDLGVPRGFMVRKLQTHGCSIRFVFREENFS